MAKPFRLAQKPRSSYDTQTLAAAIGVALTAGAAHAQAPHAAPDDIETLVVEGRAYQRESDSVKFTAPLLDTPKSVTVIPESLIEERAATSLVDALKTVPGVTYNAGEGGQPAGDNLKIRGFDAGNDVFIDGVRDGGSQTRDVFALEQVEVVKGPGSAYTGRGSTGGTVNLVTKKPSLEPFTVTSFAAGTDANGRATLDGNYLIGDSVALRLNALAHDADVPGRDAVSFSRRGLAPTIAFGIDGPTRVDLSHYHYRSEEMPDYSIPYSRNADNTAPAGEPVDVDRTSFYGLVNRDFQDTGSDVVTIELEHRFSDSLSLRNTTRHGVSFNDYIVTNPDDSRANVPNGFVLRNTKSRNSETTTIANLTDVVGRYSTGRIDHTFVAGIEISNEEMYNRNYAVETTFNGNATSDFASSCSFPGAVGALSSYNCTTLDNPNPYDPWFGAISPSPNATLAETDTRSIYAFETMTFDEQWSLNLGMRFDDYATRQWSGPVGAPALLENDSSFWNHQIGLVYKPVANGSVYVSSGTSSNPSGSTLGDGTENLGGSNADLEPERSRTEELGTKWDFAKGRVSLTAALFHTEKENARVATEPGRGAPQQTIGKQAVDGFELGVTGAVTGNLTMLASYTHLDSEIVDAGPVSSDAGNLFPNTPENSGSLWLTYDVGPRVSFGGGATYVDLRYGNTANTVWVPSYTTYDAMASVVVSERMRVQMNVLNITDAVYFERPYASHYAAIGAGRSAVVTLSLDF